jgi:membrane fusion protein, adhesin transport system
MAHEMPSSNKSVAKELLRVDDSSSPINALETRVRPKLVSGLLLWLIVGFFLVALLWAWLTEVDKSVSAIGRVIPSSQLQTVSNLEGGIVDTIYVKTGQLVAAGAPLIQLNQTFS